MVKTILYIGTIAPGTSIDFRKVKVTCRPIGIGLEALVSAVFERDQ